MRRRTIALADALLVLLSTGASAAKDTSGKPALRVVRGTPLTLRGVHFRADERVRNVVRTARRAAKRVTAGAAGGFAFSFPTLEFDRCLGLFGTATGLRGSRARLKRPALQCPPRL